MKLHQKLISLGTVLAALVLGPSCSTPAGKQADLYTPLVTQSTEGNPTKRKVRIDARSPVSDFEANAHLKQSIDEILGAGSDRIGASGLDESALARVAIVGTHLYISDVTQFMSHELGHLRAGKGYGSYSWDGSVFDFLTISGSPKLSYTPTGEQDAKIRGAGLNQDEYNAWLVMQSNPTTLKFDQGIHFLRTKFYDVFYALSEYGRTPELGMSDPTDYRLALKEQGIDLSRDQLLLQMTLADILSLQTCTSVAAVANYLGSGERTSDNLVFSAGSTEFTAPLINHYLTPQGGFYDISANLNPRSNHPFTIHVGTDADFIGSGNVDTLRVGGQLHNVSLTDNIEVSPFAFVSTSRSTSLDFQGFAAGLDSRLKLSEDVSLVGRVQYNDDDVVESDIKGKGNGFYATAGIEFKF